MTQFIFNDFISDYIPECPLSNSDVVRQAAIRTIDDLGEILEIYLVGVLYQETILFEWFVSHKKNNSDQTATLHLPLYIPQDANQAAEIIQKHYRAFQNDETMIRTLKANDYLLIGEKYPCQLVCNEKGTLYIKRIELFASQKLVQDFFTSMTNAELVTATMVITTFHIPGRSDKIQDIGWLLNIDGDSSFINLSWDTSFLSLCIIDECKEVNLGDKFALSGQEYIISEDEDNGQFIAKCPSKRST